MVVAAPHRCIYCQKNPPDSKEDWFPRWLGVYKGVELLRDRLCVDCNGDLGRTVDQVMSRAGPEALSRYRLGIEGRDTDWTKANPFTYKSQGTEPPTTATVRFDDLDFKPLMEDVRGVDPPEHRCQRQIVLRRDGKPETVRVPDKVNGAWLREAVEKRGLLGASLSHIVCEAVEVETVPPTGTLPEWFRKALAHVFPDAKDIAWLLREGGPRVNLPSTTIVGIFPEYMRAVAKIAFHYFLKFEQHLNGSEEAFRGIRDYIYAGTGDWCDFVVQESRPFVLQSGKRPEYICHVFFVESDSNNILKVRMQLFLNGPYQGPSILVQLGKDEFVRRLYFGHLLKLYDKPENGWSGELAKLPVEKHSGDGRAGVLLR